MWINDVHFNASLEEILAELQAQLRINHIPYLQKEPKRSGQSLQVQCPYHKDGQEKNRSAGIRERDGLFHCLACGETHSLPEFITHCFGHDEDVLGKFGWKWLLKNFATVQIEQRESIPLDFSRQKHAKKEITYVSEEELDNYRYTHSYWKKRGIINEDLIELFDLGYDIAAKCITFPVRDLTGGTLFVARRSVRYKHFNYPPNVEKPLYGLYEIYKTAKKEYDLIGKPFIYDFPSEVIICESMLDALTCWQYGKQAVALNGTGSERQLKELQELPCRELIIATDNDKAGIKAYEKIKSSVTNKLVYRYEIPQICREDGSVTKDINDLTEIEFKNLKKHL